ncbi:MFS transporter [Lactobacillus sp. Sy-1]|uniref:MFS transporter n=1 Tax=Lactobacillus sp. Sy-1 TaxID=2109645 RepID=UPI001C5A7B33|nr:MFS transporter [Lactobacillus sp. Sy-1]MBW1606140.1 MFS transporter [Lactobacillus sp. Sy-1]
MNKRQLLLTTGALLVANFMGGLDATIVNTTLPAITSDLNGIQLIGWISSAFLLGVAVTTVLWGRLGEIINNKLTFQIAVLLFVVSSFMAGVAPNMIFLIVMRALMGIGTGGMVSIPFIIYAQIYPEPRERAKAVGLVTASYAFATVLGPILGGFIVDHFSWHWIFFINVPIGLLSIVILQFEYRINNFEKPQSRFDYRGAGLLTITLVVTLFASSLLSIDATLTIILVGIAIILGIIFYQVEKRISDALVPVQLLKNWPVQSQNIIMFLINGYFIGFSVYAPMWAQGILGTDATAGGLTQIAGSLLLMVGTRLTARLMKRLPYRTIVGLGTLSICLSALTMFLATQGLPYVWLLISGAFNGFGMGLSFTPMQISVQDGVPKRLMGVSTTFGLLVRTLGETFMAAIFGTLFSMEIVQQTGPDHTLTMVTKLTNFVTAKNLPADRIPQLRTMLFSGLHLVMSVGLGLAIFALVLNLFRRLPANELKKDLKN